MSNGAVHNECMQTASHRSTVALFVALTRAVREAPVADGLRQRTFNLIDRMAGSLGLPGFQTEFGTLLALANEEPLLQSTLQPFWEELRALSAPPLVRAQGTPDAGIDDHRRN